MKEQLEKFIYKKTELEIIQQKTHECVFDLPPSAVNHTSNGIQLEPNFFFQNKEISINKHSRFADFPLHSHKFIELNYMLHGNCTQYVNGNKVILNSGDILLLDIGSRHLVKSLGKDDILMNILFHSTNIHVDLINKLQTSQSIIFDFLLNTTIGIQATGNYFVFKQQDWHDHEVYQILESIISEYFFPSSFSDELISSYLPILFILLVRNFQTTLVSNNKHKYYDPVMLRVLSEIENHYTTITLDQIAIKLNYNKSYLSTLIRRKSGVTFTELLNHQRLLQAHMLITSTNLSITSIIERVGFTNRTYFYHQFKLLYNALPQELRQI